MHCAWLAWKNAVEERGSSVDPELPVQTGEMLLDRLLGIVEQGSDFLGGEPFQDEARHLILLVGQARPAQGAVDETREDAVDARHLLQHVSQIFGRERLL